MMNFKKNWKVHACWLVVVTMILAFIALLWSYKEIRALRLDLADAQQSLAECRHSFSIWDSQIESGSVDIIKRDGDKEIIERWKMTKEAK